LKTKQVTWLITVLAIPSAAAAQGGLARLVGTVRDQSGAFIPGATVVVRNEKTGEVFYADLERDSRATHS
jgi:hypothetical protein